MRLGQWCACLVQLGGCLRASRLFCQGDGFHGDHQFFVGRGDQRGDLGAWLADDDLFAAAIVGLLVQLAAQDSHAVDDDAAGGDAVFTDAAGEDDSVGTAEQEVVAADVVDEAVDEGAIGLFGPGVALVAGGLDVAHVAGQAGHSEQAAFLIEDIVDFGSGVSCLGHEEGDDGWVEVAAAGSHHQSHEGGQAHAGVNDFAAVDSCQAAAIAQVAGYDFGFGWVEAEEFAAVEVDEFVAGAVEAVFAHVVFFVEFAWDGVQVGFGSHALVEGGVEDGYVGDAGEDVFAGFDAAEISGVMERTKDDALANAFLDRFVN